MFLFISQGWGRFLFACEWEDAVLLCFGLIDIFSIYSLCCFEYYTQQIRNTIWSSVWCYDQDPLLKSLSGNRDFLVWCLIDLEQISSQ